MTAVQLVDEIIRRMIELHTVKSNEQMIDSSKEIEAKINTIFETLVKNHFNDFKNGDLTSILEKRFPIVSNKIKP